MKKIYFSLFLIIAAPLFLLPATNVQADACTPNMCMTSGNNFRPECCPKPNEGLVPCGTACCPCQFCHLFVLLDNVIDFLLIKIVPPLAALMIAIAGFMYMFSNTGLLGGDKLSQAKSIFKSVAIGLLLMYGAWIIVGTFFQIVGLDSWTTDMLGNWWNEGFFEIKCP